MLNFVCLFTTISTFGEILESRGPNVLKNYTKESQQPARACVIWLHGLGADASHMMSIANALPEPLPPLRHVFVDAPIRSVTLNNGMRMRAWYDITGLNLKDREDRTGILESEQLLTEIIEAQIQAGFTRGQIFLAGFSQGGAMALFTGIRARESLGGIMALSSYLPLPSECLSIAHDALPVFIAAGSLDQVVSPTWTRLSYDFVKAQGLKQVTWKEYPIEHVVCMNELRDIAQWLTQYLPSDSTQGDDNDRG